MNVEIGAEATLFPEMEYINRIAVAVFLKLLPNHLELHPLPNILAKNLVWCLGAESTSCQWNVLNLPIQDTRTQTALRLYSAKRRNILYMSELNSR